MSLKFELEKESDCKQENIFFNIWTEPSGVVVSKAKEGQRGPGKGINHQPFGWVNYALVHFMPLCSMI